MKTITLYSKPNCSYCNAAKIWLTEHEFPFWVIDVSTDAESLAFLRQEGHRTMPQIYYEKNLVVEGGYSGLIKMGADKLKEILS